MGLGIKSDYDRWLEAEKVPVFSGFNVPNLKEIELEPWDRIGGKVMYILLDGAENTNDAYVAEIAPTKQLKVERHLYEEVIYILKGRGATTVWHEEEKKQAFEWQEGSLFLIPPNAFHQLYNTSGSEPARFYAVTTAPLLINYFHNHDFVFNNDFRFTDRFNGDRDFFSGKGTTMPERRWGTNFIPDVRSFPLQTWKERGAGGKNVMLELGDNALVAHISEFPLGTYKKAHRHGPGAHVIIVEGRGFSLLWREGEEKKKVDWEAGSVLVPPNMVFHQHFNTGNTPARYLAIRWGSKKHPVFSGWSNVTQNLKQGGNQIEYEDEDPAVRRLFEQELAKNNAKSKMPVTHKK